MAHSLVAPIGCPGVVKANCILAISRLLFPILGRHFAAPGSDAKLYNNLSQ